MEGDEGWPGNDHLDSPKPFEQGSGVQGLLFGQAGGLLEEGSLPPSLPTLPGSPGQVGRGRCMPSKPRLRWTPELHHQFLAAANKLGGPLVATPKQILVQMAVPGLTLFHVKSHLQKYRIAISGGGGSRGEGSQRKRRGSEAADSGCSSGSKDDRPSGGERQRGQAAAKEGRATAGPQASADGQAVAAAASAAGQPLPLAAEDAQQLDAASSPDTSAWWGAAGGAMGNTGEEAQPGSMARELSCAGRPLREVHAGQKLLAQLRVAASAASGGEGALVGARPASLGDRSPVLQQQATPLLLPLPLAAQLPGSRSGEGGSAQRGGQQQRGSLEAAVELSTDAAEAGGRDSVGGEEERQRMEQAVAVQRDLQGQLQAALEAQRQLQTKMLAHGKLLQSLIKGVGGTMLLDSDPTGKAMAAEGAAVGERLQGTGGSGLQKGRRAHSKQGRSAAWPIGGGSSSKALAQYELPTAGAAARQYLPLPLQQEQPYVWMSPAALAPGSSPCSAFGGRPSPEHLPPQQAALPPLPPPHLLLLQQQQQQQGEVEDVLVGLGPLPAVCVDPSRVLARLANGLPVHQLELAALSVPTSPSAVEQGALWASRQSLQQPPLPLQQQQEQEPPLDVWADGGWGESPEAARGPTLPCSPLAQQSAAQAGMWGVQDPGSQCSPAMKHSAPGVALPAVLASGMAPAEGFLATPPAELLQTQMLGAAAAAAAPTEALPLMSGVGPEGARCASQVKLAPSTSGLAMLDQLLDAPDGFEDLLGGDFM